MQLESLLLEDPEIAFRARQFMYLYNLLDEQFSGDTAAMAHWMRRKKCVSGYAPLLAMVDQGRMEDVIAVTSKKR